MSSGNKVLKYSIALMAMSVSIANAVPVSISTGYQNEGFGQFSGTIDYAAASSNSATLTLTLKNEAGTAAGGKITGVALNLPDASGITGLISGAPNNSWSQLGINQNAVSADPLGAFDFGEALGGSWLGGGSPNAGIVIGATGTFVFNFSGNGLNNLTTSSFLNAFAPGY